MKCGEYYTKPEKKPDQVVELSLVLDEVVQNMKFHSVLSKEIQWELQLTPHKIMGFSEKLKQSFLNIVINAAQALENRPQPVIRISIGREDNFVVVKIKDNGAGMKPETLKRLFEPFHTTKIKGPREHLKFYA